MSLFKIGLFIEVPSNNYVEKKSTITIVEPIIYAVGSIVPVVKDQKVIGLGRITGYSIKDVKGTMQTTVSFNFTKASDAESVVLTDLYNRNLISSGKSSGGGDYQTTAHIPGIFRSSSENLGGKKTSKKRRSQIWEEDDDDYDEDDYPTFGRDDDW